MSNVKYGHLFPLNATFTFNGTPNIASDMKYVLQFATNNSEKYMNIYMKSSRLAYEESSFSSSVCLSKEQMFEVRDYINKIYPLDVESNQSSEKSEPKPKPKSESVSILFDSFIETLDGLYGKDADGRLYLINGTSARLVTLA